MYNFLHRESFYHMLISTILYWMPLLIANFEEKQKAHYFSTGTNWYLIIQLWCTFFLHLHCHSYKSAIKINYSSVSFEVFYLLLYTNQFCLYHFTWQALTPQILRMFSSFFCTYRKPSPFGFSCHPGILYPFTSHFTVTIWSSWHPWAYHSTEASTLRW